MAGLGFEASYRQDWHHSAVQPMSVYVLCLSSRCWVATTEASPEHSLNFILFFGCGIPIGLWLVCDTCRQTTLTHASVAFYILWPMFRRAAFLSGRYACYILKQVVRRTLLAGTLLSRWRIWADNIMRGCACSYSFLLCRCQLEKVPAYQSCGNRFAAMTVRSAEAPASLVSLGRSANAFCFSKPWRRSCCPQLLLDYSGAGHFIAYVHIYITSWPEHLYDLNSKKKIVSGASSFILGQTGWFRFLSTDFIYSPSFSL